jgi:hypothetical protein
VTIVLHCQLEERSLSLEERKPHSIEAKWKNDEAQRFYHDNNEL